MARDKGQDVDSGMWMLTFSDLLSLLLTFFVLLFAMKALDKNKLDEFLGYFRGGGMGTLELGKEMSVSSMTGPEEFVISAETISLTELKNAINISLRKLNIEDKVSLHSDDHGLILMLSDAILFDSGSSVIRPESTLILDRLSETLKENNYHIIVEGHTDDQPISTDKFPSNWELSIDRASKVLRYFVETCNMYPERFSAAGYADTKFLVSNINPDNRKKNRRVEIRLIPPGQGR